MTRTRADPSPVIPAKRPKGARAGIHNHETCKFAPLVVMDSGLAAARRPGMTRGTPMLRTVADFDRIGEENAFAVLARATALSQQGRDIINLGIGQPDFRTPDHIVEAAIKALRDG